MSDMPKQKDWTKPAAMAIPKEGYFKLEKGRYGPIFPKTPASYGFSILAKIKPGTEEKIREYGKKIEKTIAELPDALAVLDLHYLRWILFDIGKDTYFMYQGIFDTDFDKYTEDAVALFGKYGLNTVFEHLEGFPADWKTNAPAFVKFAREHQCPSFLEYAEYPYVSAGEIKKALRLKGAFCRMLDLMEWGGGCLLRGEGFDLTGRGGPAVLEFDDIQYFLISRPRALAARYEFLTFRQPAGGRAWLMGIIEKVRSAKGVGANQSDSRWVTVALTWNGLRALGVDETSLATFPEEVRQGMAARAQS